MPLIAVDTFPGKSPEQKRRFVESVTRAAVEHLGVTADSVIVLIRETPTESWGYGGRLCSELFSPPPSEPIIESKDDTA